MTKKEKLKIADSVRGLLIWKEAVDSDYNQYSAGSISRSTLPATALSHIRYYESRISDLESLGIDMVSIRENLDLVKAVYNAEYPGWEGKND